MTRHRGYRVSLPVLRVVRTLDRIIEWRGKPKNIGIDNVSDYVNGALHVWVNKRGIALSYIQPGKPQQKANMERYNRTVRHEWLGQYLFDTIEKSTTTP